MKTKNSFFRRMAFAAVLPLAMLTACLSDDRGETAITGNKENAQVTFSLTLPGSSQPTTKGLTEVQENAVEAIDVLAFEQGTGEYVYAARCSGTSISTDGTNSRKKTFTVTLRTGNYDLVILANARNIATEAALTGRTKATALQQLKASVTDKWAADGSRAIPMWGDVGNVTISEQTDLTGTKAIKLTRMVARVDVQVAAQNFTLSSIRVYNYNTEGSVVPQSTQWDAATDPAAPKATAPNVPSTATRVKGPLVYSGSSIITDNNCTKEIYIFESESHTATDHATAKTLTERTCLVIGGKYASDTKDTYYRVDFSTGSGISQQFIDVLRNHQYIFNINKISGPGYEDPEDAFNSAPVNIEAEVLQWNDAEMGTIIFDGQNFLTVTPGEFSFYKNVVTTDETTNRLTIHTDVSTGWKIDASKISYTPTGEQWLTPSVTNGGTTKQTIWLGATANNTGSERTAVVPVSAGRLVYYVTVKQSTAAPKVPAFSFIEYINVNGSGLTLPVTGGQIQAKVNTNMGWSFRTNHASVTDASMTEPVEEFASERALSVTIPELTDKWATAITKVWVEYVGARIQETAFTQIGYNITSITGAPDAVNADGGSYTLTFTGYFPTMNVRAYNSDGATVQVTAAGSATASGSQTVAVNVPANSTTAIRNVVFQYEKNPGEWVDIKTVSQPSNKYDYIDGFIIDKTLILTRHHYVMEGSADCPAGTHQPRNPEEARAVSKCANIVAQGDGITWVGASYELWNNGRFSFCDIEGYVNGEYGQRGPRWYSYDTVTKETYEDDEAYYRCIVNY